MKKIKVSLTHLNVFCGCFFYLVVFFLFFFVSFFFGLFVCLLLFLFVLFLFVFVCFVVSLSVCLVSFVGEGYISFTFNCKCLHRHSSTFTLLFVLKQITQLIYCEFSTNIGRKRGMCVSDV